MAKISLKKISGLPLYLKGGKVIFGELMGRPRREIKNYRRYKKFFLRSPALDKNKEMYYIYRNSCLKKDVPVFSRNGLRYDITVLAPGNIGREPVRTIGHTHKPFKGERSAEIYQVVSGSALFLLHDTKTNIIYKIPRKAGQKIVIPGICAHITINRSSKKPLVVANIFTSRENSSDYAFFKKTHGPSWYPIRKKGWIDFQKNPNGNQLAKLFLPVKRVSLPKGISSTKPLYDEFVKNPEKFIFLNQPSRYAKTISPQKLFR
jgi:glucose-6-phosphate isomerase